MIFHPKDLDEGVRYQGIIVTEGLEIVSPVELLIDEATEQPHPVLEAGKPGL
jgi:hypothetical protein